MATTIKMSQSNVTLLVWAFFGIFLAIVSVPLVFRFRNEQKCLPTNETLYWPQDLSQYTQLPTILLGFLGVVYNVSSGHYYHPGGSYAFFSGRDGTRAFLTGEFHDETELRDDITDLDRSYLNGLDTWVRLYQEKYPRLGLVVGTYYDQNGCPTDKLAEVEKFMEEMARAKQLEKDELKQYPPCNSQWDSKTESGRVWCTKLSGGIQREWAGRPRLFFDFYQKKWRCACINAQNEDDLDFCDTKKDSHQKIGMEYDENSDHSSEQPNCRFKFYPKCDSDASECLIS